VAEKTEPPSQKKLRDARKKGNVAHSKEVVTTALMVVLFGYFWVSWGSFIEQTKQILTFPPQFYQMPFREGIKLSFDIGLKMVTAILVPVIGLTIMVTIVANVAMVGFLLAGEAAKPSLDKLNPASGIKRIFGMKNLIENLKSIVKTIFLCVLLYVLIKNAVGPLIQAPVCGMPCLQSVLADVMKTLVIYTTVGFIILAAIDYGWTKWKYTKDLMMSMEEVKQEYKESEGDPHVKGHRKQLAHEIAMGDEGHAVKNASVVVTNPTHIAVALRYEPGKTPLPMVVAKGERLNAERIIAIAREAGVPVMQNIPLARSLFEESMVDTYIPSDLIEPVAEVLRWVRALKQEQEGG
jgi:type III secretion protein U